MCLGRVVEMARGVIEMARGVIEMARGVIEMARGVIEMAALYKDCYRQVILYR